MSGWDDFVEFCACDWKDHGGWFFEFWKLEPCCGKPVNLGDAIHCVVCFTCCAFCSCTKLYASSLDQQCALINHGIPMLIAPCALCCMRHNFRYVPFTPFLRLLSCYISTHSRFIQPNSVRNGIGPQDFGGWVGDFVFGWFLPCFMGCQILRGSESKAYDWLGQCGETGVICCVNPCKPVYDFDQVMEMPEKDLTGIVKDANTAADSGVKKLGGGKIDGGEH